MCAVTGQFVMIMAPTTMVICCLLIAVTIAKGPTHANADLVLDVLAQFRLRGAKCAVLIAPSNASWPLSARQNDVLPIISVTTDVQEASILLEARNTCPFYLFQSLSVMDTDKFLQDNYAFLKRRIAHYVHLLEEEEGVEFLKLPYFEKVLHALVITRTDHNSTYAIRERQPCASIDPRLIKTWTPVVGFNPPGSMFSDDLLDDLACRHITASTFNYPPFAYLHRHENGSVTFTGTEVTIFQTIAKHLKFDYTIREPLICCGFGVKPKPGRNATGQSAELTYGLSDVSFSQLFYNPQKAALNEMTSPYDTDSVCFMHRLPPPLSPWTSLYVPLGSIVWIMVLVTIGCSLSFMALYSKLHPNAEYSASDFTVFILGTIVEASQAHLAKLRTPTVKVFYCLFAISFVVLSSSYKGALTSSLSIKKLPPPLNTWKDFAESGSPVGSLFAHAMMGTLPNPYVRKMDETYEVYNQYVDDAMARLEAGTYAILESSYSMEFLIRSQFTNKFGETGMHIGTECLVSFGVSFGLPKDSILVDKFSFIINQLLEAGLTRKWFNDAMDDVAKSSKAAQKPENAPFTLEQLQGAFSIWLFGLIFGCAAFLLEKFTRIVGK